MLQFSVKMSGGGIAQLVECPTEKPGALLKRVRVPAAARELSPKINFRCRLAYGVCVSVQSHASAAVHALKIPNIGSHTIVWTHENAAHTDRNG